MKLFEKLKFNPQTTQQDKDILLVDFFVAVLFSKNPSIFIVCEKNKEIFEFPNLLKEKVYSYSKGITFSAALYFSVLAASWLAGWVMPLWVISGMAYLFVCFMAGALLSDFRRSFIYYYKSLRNKVLYEDMKKELEMYLSQLKLSHPKRSKYLSLQYELREKIAMLSTSGQRDKLETTDWFILYNALKTISRINFYIKGEDREIPFEDHETQQLFVSEEEKEIVENQHFLEGQIPKCATVPPSSINTKAEQAHSSKVHKI